MLRDKVALLADHPKRPFLLPVLIGNLLSSTEALEVACVLVLARYPVDAFASLRVLSMWALDSLLKVRCGVSELKTSFRLDMSSAGRSKNGISSTR